MQRLALALFPLLTVAATTLLMSSRPSRMEAPASGVPGKVPVVVELFTSEGCSSCPSADAALRELETAQSVAGAEVLALGQHVDYWNRLGWKDPYSSPAFTQRQRDYAEGFGAGSYTPQAVVNGQYAFVGSRRQELAETVAKAARAPHATVRLSRAATGSLSVYVADLPTAKPATVLLALTETGLSSQVGRGENSGRLLHHAAVVRELRPLGSVGADGTFVAAVPLKLNARWKAPNVRAVVLVQETGSRHIVGVGSLPLREATAAAASY
ncbi:MAG: DUF1223 domain-containing protein [Hymenobacter sp.]|nr:DUF1223 domain-containing protein [Hymenobacter sp.]